MITYSRLGQNGRLGNQLWQIASTIGIAVLHGDEFSFPAWEYAEHFKMPSEWFCGLPGVESDSLALRLPEKARPYLQDSYYVKAAEPIIREAFQLKVAEAFDHYGEWAAVHVRRGDYAEAWRGHGMLAKQWYLNNWPEGKVRVFSDDPQWCFENLPGIVEDGSEIEDLAKMTKCRELVISNSSFAWWAAWMSQKPVTYPDPWFTAQPVGDMHWSGWLKVQR